MNKDFTNRHKNNLSQIDQNNLDPTEALNFLQNPDNFRSFSEGLIQLLEETTPSITFNNHKERTEYLYKKLKFIGSDIQKSTIAAWFEGIHTPKLVSNSRKLMYEVCFALELPMEKVIWFFHHVYFERNFNCHMIDEAVYYYCFKHNMTYSSAKSIIKKIMERPEKPSKNSITIYTQKIREEIDKIFSTEKLIDYLSNNKSMFQKWNLSAKDSINDFLEDILRKKGSKQIIENFKKKGSIPSDAIENCGLIIQELYHYRHDNEQFLEDISGKNILSIDFMLDMILETKFGIQKTAVIPDIVKSNFPSKKVFSDILNENKSNTSTSYDSIKKVLVLLKFYQFWCNIDLHNTFPELTPEELYNVFIDETNDLLFRCGYENLYEGNPYDWIFMRSSKASRPLDFLRGFVGTIKDTEEKDDF